MTTATTSKPEPPIAVGTLTLKTLSGDIRDRMEALARSWTKPFSELGQADQQDVIDTLTGVGEDTARDSLIAVAGRALPTLGMKVVSAQRKGKTMRVTLEAAYTKQGWAGFGDCEEVIAVQAAPDTYYGERAPLRARPDQPGLDLDNEDDGATDEVEASDDGAEAADALALDQQAQGIVDAVGEAEALGPEAQANTDLLTGIQPLDAAQVEPLAEANALAPTKRGGKRRSMEERQRAQDAETAAAAEHRAG